MLSGLQFLRTATYRNVVFPLVSQRFVSSGAMLNYPQTDASDPKKEKKEKKKPAVKKASLKKKTEKKKGLEIPKKPSGVRIFVQENLKDGVKRHELVQQWSNFADDVKANYKQKAEASWKKILDDFKPTALANHAKIPQNFMKLYQVEAPKRPNSIYSLFVSQVGNMKKAAERWHSLPSSEKEALQAKVDEARKQYEVKLAEFKKFAIENPLLVSKKDRKKYGPKKPAKGFAAYLKENLSKHKGGKISDAFKILAQEWRSLTPEQKQKYHN